MAEKVVDDFIAHFAALTDETDRARLMAQVKLRAAAAAPEEAFEAPVVNLRDYLANPIPVPPSLVWPTIVVRGEITTTLGRAGKGKTTMNLNRIFAWAAGRSLFPGWIDADGNEYLAPEKPLRTLIAENEGNAGMFHQKMGLLLYEGALSKHEQELALDNLFIHGDGGYSGMKLDNDEGVDKLRAAISACQPDVVFVEPFRSLWRGEENSATDMAVVVDNMVAIATEFQCGIILSHHERKGGGDGNEDKMSNSRGSTVLEGVVAVMENFESVVGGQYRELMWSKSRYLPPPAPVRMEWNRNTGWYTWVPQDAIDDNIIRALRDADDEPMTLKDLSEELGETVTKLRPRMGQLVEDGKVKKMPSLASQGGTTGLRYRLPSGGTPNEGGLAV